MNSTRKEQSDWRALIRRLVLVPPLVALAVLMLSKPDLPPLAPAGPQLSRGEAFDPAMLTSTIALPTTVGEVEPAVVSDLVTTTVEVNPAVTAPLASANGTDVSSYYTPLADASGG